MGILEKDSSQIFQSVLESKTVHPRRVLPQLWVPSQVRDSLAQWSSAQAISSATSQTAGDLWASSDLGAQYHLGSRRLSLVGSSEGAATGVDALGSETLSLNPRLEQQLLRLSPRTIDYRLRVKKRQLKKRIYGRTKPGTLLKHHIPLKTDCWNVRQPGFTEVDLVSHAGNCASGDCCHSLNLTDIHTTWVETRAVLGKGQEGVRRAMETIRQALPFKLLGIDSDNGSEFINAHLYHYCQALDIQFTRGRPYKKDDNAHIEQKNWTHVRRLLGYERYDSPTALEALNDLYGQELRLFQNLFLPSVKLRRKVRVGSKLKRVYDPPQTPFQRVCASKQVIPAKVAQLQQWRDTLGSVPALSSD
jgi:hypothetical protein